MVRIAVKEHSNTESSRTSIGRKASSFVGHFAEITPVYPTEEESFVAMF